MKLRYTTTFVDINENKYEIDVYRSGYTGSVDEIILTDDAVHIQYETDDIFKPIKQSGASIKILTRGILKDIYTGKITDVKINIYKVSSDNTKTLFWTGFNTPNNYNSPYSDLYDETGVEAIDKISALEYFKYETIGTETSIDTFFNIIKNVLKKVNFDKEIKTIEYINSLDDNNGEILNQLKANERNWYDEKEEASTCLEVLEHICQFLGVTLTQYKDKLIMREVNSLQKGKENKVTTYNLEDGSTRESTEIVGSHTYECAEDTCNVSLGDVYNQVNVLANIIDEEEEIIDISSDDNDHLHPIDNGVYINYVILDENYEGRNNPSGPHVDDNYDVTKSKCIIYTFYKRDDCDMPIPSLTYSNEYLLTGDIPSGKSMIERYNIIEQAIPKTWGYVETESARAKMTNGVIFKIGNTLPLPLSYLRNQVVNPHLSAVTTLNSTTIFSKTVKPSKYVGGDYLILSFNLNYSSNVAQGIPLNNETQFPSPFVYENYKIISYYPALFYTELSSTIIPFVLKCKLKVGDYYYTNVGNLGSWVTNESYFYVDGASVNVQSDCSNTFHPYNTNVFYNKSKSRTSGIAIMLPYDVYGELLFEIEDCMCKPYNKTELSNWKASATTIPSGYERITSQIDRKKVGDEKNDYYDIDNVYAKFCHIDNIKLEHSSSGSTSYNVLDIDQKDSDIKYSADIDESNVTEFSDITLYLNTYNPEKYNHLSYSYVFKSDMSFLQKVNKNGVNARPEEHIVQMYVEHYENPKLIYENTLETDNIKPFDLIYVPYSPKYGTWEGDDRQTFINKYFVVGSIDYDLRKDRVNTKIYEL